MDNYLNNTTTELEKKKLFHRRNCYVETLYLEKEIPLAEVDKVFDVVLKNFLLYKDELMNYKTQNKDTFEFFAWLENTYWHVEMFLNGNFAKLSPDNKKYAERFLDIFSKSKVCGPTYAKRLIYGDISFGERKEDLKVAAKRLAAAVYTLETPFVNFAASNSANLAKMFQNGWIPGYTPEESKKKAAIVLFRNRSGDISNPSLFDELGVDVMDLLKKELYPYCEKEKECSWKGKNKTVEECMQDEFFVHDVMFEAAEDICASLLTEEERTQKDICETAFEYFSNHENYPDLPDVDLDAMIAFSETKHKES